MHLRFNFSYTRHAWRYDIKPIFIWMSRCLKDFNSNFLDIIYFSQASHSRNEISYISTKKKGEQTISFHSNSNCVSWQRERNGCWIDGEVRWRRRRNSNVFGVRKRKQIVERKKQLLFCQLSSFIFYFLLASTEMPWDFPLLRAESLSSNRVITVKWEISVKSLYFDLLRFLAKRVDRFTCLSSHQSEIFSFFFVVSQFRI